MIQIIIPWLQIAQLCPNLTGPVILTVIGYKYQCSAASLKTLYLKNIFAHFVEFWLLIDEKNIIFFSNFDLILSSGLIISFGTIFQECDLKFTTYRLCILQILIIQKLLHGNSYIHLIYLISNTNKNAW